MAISKGRVVVASLIAVGILGLAMQCGGDDSKDKATTGGSSQVKPSDVKRIIVDADSATTCNENSQDVISVRASGLAAGDYSVALTVFDTSKLVGDTHQVTVGANGKLSDTIRCQGLAAEQYRATVTSQSGDAQGSDAVDVYPVKK
jgi:hypothetical protein